MAMSGSELLTQYRLRRLAMQFREFTVRDLETAAGVSSQAVHNFLHELGKLDPDQIEKKSIGAEGPGRPRLKYLLKPKALHLLAEMNLEVAQELNSEALEHASSRQESRRETLQ